MSAWTRREIFGFSVLAAVASAFRLEGVARAASAKVAKATYAENIYTRMFGVRPVIGAFEPLSRYGNSMMAPEVLDAMREAQEFFVDVEELNRAAGARIAAIMKAEAAMVTSCSYGAMMLGAAAILTGTDRDKIEALPQVTWPKRECLIQKAHRVPYDRAFRGAGMAIVEVETRDQLVNAINDRTAMIAVIARVERDPQPEVMQAPELIELGKKSGIPVLVDAAGELPPLSRLTRYTELGADLVNFSGGKNMCGPSSSGILAGRKDLIEAALLHASPNANIGRGQKVNREEIVGLVVALEQYIRMDQDAMLAKWSRRSRYIVDELRGIPGLTPEYRMTSQGYANAVLVWDKKVIPINERDAADKLRNGEPRIVFTSSKLVNETIAHPTLVPASLRGGEEVIVAKRLKQFFLAEAVKPSTQV
jgi:L-seryl-tRNA(Ser) seleniumtransferase